MPLGFDPSLTLNSAADRDYRQFMASSLQQLGKQVSEGIQQIATNRQLRQLGDELKQVDPASPFFPQEMVGVITRYPLAASDRRGAAALSMMGASHKNWLSQQLKQTTAHRNEKPIVRNFTDKTTRQYNPTTKQWDVVTEAPLPSKTEKGPTLAQEARAESYKELLDLRTKEEKLQSLANDARAKYGSDSEVTAQIESGLQSFRSKIPKNTPSKSAIQRHLQVYGKRFGPALNSLGASNVAAPDAEIFAAQEEMPLQGGGSASPLTAQAVEPETLIPVQPTPTASGPTRKRYNPQTDTFE